MNDPFRIGVSPDFFAEARDYSVPVMQEYLDPVSYIHYEPLPVAGGNVATRDALAAYDAIFALGVHLPAESVRGAERLTLIARWGVGYDRIDVAALTEAGIALCITPTGVRRSVAEAILTFILALSKNLMLQDRVARAGLWRGGLPKLGRNLPGRVLGSVGCGNIGQELFRVAGPLGFRRLLACDPAVTQDQVAKLGVEMVDMETLFRESDFVAVNTPLSAATTGLIGERHFRLMKPAAFFINTARGPIVQHDALVRALRERWIAGAGIDVFPTEPVPKDDPILELDNVIVAPHALAWTEELMRDNGVEACRQALAVSRGEIPSSVVNREVLDRPGFRNKLARYRRNA
jgi:phosphoglycerate dehydrogenase-like enzyme